MKIKQSGISLIGVIVLVGLIAFFGLIAAQALPTVLEFQAITKAATKAKEGNSVAEARAIFDKAVQIDDIKSIAGKDLDVTKEANKTVVSFAYTKEIHIAGPAFLLLKYVGRSK